MGKTKLILVSEKERNIIRAALDVLRMAHPGSLARCEINDQEIEDLRYRVEMHRTLIVVREEDDGEGDVEGAIIATDEKIESAESAPEMAGMTIDPNKGDSVMVFQDSEMGAKKESRGGEGIVARADFTPGEGIAVPKR